LAGGHTGGRDPAERIEHHPTFAGLTAAGKTTHAKRLADELGYDYVSATDILLAILGIDDPSDQIWFARLGEIQAARGDGAVDIELEQRLVSLNRTRQRTVFDTWALAWIGEGPLVRIWIESDLESRVRKCLVSQRSGRLDAHECRSLIEEKMNSLAASSSADTVSTYSRTGIAMTRFSVTVISFLRQPWAQPTVESKRLAPLSAPLSLPSWRRTARVLARYSRKSPRSSTHHCSDEYRFALRDELTQGLHGHRRSQ
jgi:cytidylate kinase